MKSFLRIFIGGKPYVFLLFFNFILLFSYAQDSQQITIQPLTLKTDEAVVVYQDSLLKISVVKIDYLNQADGISHERLNYVYENLSSKKLTLTLTRSLAYNQEEIKSTDMKEVSIEIEAQSTINMFTNPKDKRCYTFSKDYKNTIQKQLTKVEISNIKVQ